MRVDGLRRFRTVRLLNRIRNEDGQVRVHRGRAESNLFQLQDNALRVVNAFFSIRDAWIKFPTEAEMSATSRRLFNKYRLPDFIGGVDE